MAEQIAAQQSRDVTLAPSLPPRRFPPITTHPRHVRLVAHAQTRAAQTLAPASLERDDVTAFKQRGQHLPTEGSVLASVVASERKSDVRVEFEVARDFRSESSSWWSDCDEKQRSDEQQQCAIEEVAEAGFARSLRPETRAIGRTEVG